MCDPGHPGSDAEIEGTSPGSFVVSNLNIYDLEWSRCAKVLACHVPS